MIFLVLKNEWRVSEARLRPFLKPTKPWELSKLCLSGCIVYTSWSIRGCPWNKKNIWKKISLLKKIGFFLLAYATGFSWVPSKNVSKFGPGVWPARADIVENDVPQLWPQIISKPNISSRDIFNSCNMEDCSCYLLKYKYRQSYILFH